MSERISGSRSFVVAAVAALLAVWASGSVVSAGPPPSQWGWVVMRQATPATSPFTPDPADQGNSAGGSDIVFHPFLGRYVVFFGSLGVPPLGIAQLSMLGSKHRICAVGQPFQDAGDTIIDIDCFDDTPAAAAADATFIVSYLAVGSSGFSHAALAYVSTDPSAGTGDLLGTSYNSEGGTNRMTRNTFGDFSVRLGRMGRFSGDIQASSMNRGVTCRVVGWAAKPTGPLTVRVLCVSLAGVGQDDPFMLTFMSHMGMKGPAGTSVAYLLANEPTARRYTPLAAYRYSSAAGSPPPRVERLGTGRYQVRLPGMPDGGAIQVTAYGDRGRRCLVQSILLTGTPPQLVEIRCMRLDGTPADARYFLAYQR